MKKLAIFITILSLLFCSISALAEPLTGPAFWALNHDQHLTGIVDSAKVENVYGIIIPEHVYVQGFEEFGIERTDGMQTVFIFDNYTCGLTPLFTSVDILPEYQDTVDSIVRQKLGYDDEQVLTVNDYVAATLYQKKVRHVARLGHIFFDERIEKVEVGTVTLNQGANTFKLYIGDFDSDLQYELGFAAN